MKKIIILIMTVFMLTSIFTGCGKTEDVSDAKANTSAPAKVNPQPEQKEVTLKLWQWRQEIVDSLQQILDEYTKQNPHVTISGERPGGNQFDATIKALMASGETPDIFAVRAWNQTKEYALSGNILDLTNEPFMANVSDAAKATVDVDGKFYGLPMQIDGGGIIYNKKVFKDAGIDKLPETITELRQVCEKLKANGIIPFGAAFRDAWTLGEEVSYLHTQTTDVVQFAKDMNDGKTSFKNPKMDIAFQVIDLIGENCNEKPMDSDYNDVCALIAQGKAGMMVQGVWAMPVIQKINPDFDGGFIPVPFSETPGEARMTCDTSVVFHIYSKSENIDETKKLLSWFTMEEAGKMFGEKCSFLTPFKNATPPTGGGTVWNDLAEYSAKGAVVPFGNAIWPTGYEDQLGQLMQGYYTKEYDREQLYTEMDKVWMSFIK